LLILDEPTNDLDLETLELLESSLQEYEGSVLLVSHDRAFMDAVATQTLVAQGEGLWREYPGGYSDWIDQGGEWLTESTKLAAKSSNASALPASALPASASVQATSTNARRKLSYKEQRELDTMPERIEALEVEQTKIQAAMSSSDYYRLGPEQMRQDKARVDQIDDELLALLERWEALQAIESR
jgi:ATP-binding cassette subfamily F protein uup